MRFLRSLGTDRPVIGMIHLPPLVGYDGFPGLSQVIEMALQDLDALQQGGVDAVMVENNYNLPHRIVEELATVECMKTVVGVVARSANVPVGVCVLWNDYRAALNLARSCGGTFVRVPVFVDEVMTHYGRVKGDPEAVLSYRRTIDAEDISLLVDVHVKHADLVSSHSIGEAATLAKGRGADAVIITGKWTGDPPSPEELGDVRSAVGNFPILVGSGSTAENVDDLLQVADGVIVATALKTGLRDETNVNLKGFEERIAVEAVRSFMSAARRAVNQTAREEGRASLVRDAA